MIYYSSQSVSRQRLHYSQNLLEYPSFSELIYSVHASANKDTTLTSCLFVTSNLFARTKWTAQLSIVLVTNPKIYLLTQPSIVLVIAQVFLCVVTQPNISNCGSDTFI